jgi:cytochrome c1
MRGLRVWRLPVPSCTSPPSLSAAHAQAPAGVTLAAGQYYNPYFAGGKIGMAKQLVDGAVEFPDGTPATESREWHLH